MSLNNLIKNDGKILIVGGMPKEYEGINHPQLEIWPGEADDMNRIIHNKLEQGFNHNFKAVVISRFISHDISEILLREARKKNAVILNQKTSGEIKKIILEVTGPDAPPKEKKVMAPHGAIKQLVTQHDVISLSSDTIAQLQLLKEEVGKTQTELTELRDYKDRVAKLMGSLNGK